jgi:hypothetical protein
MSRASRACLRATRLAGSRCHARPTGSRVRGRRRRGRGKCGLFTFARSQIPSRAGGMCGGRPPSRRVLLQVECGSPNGSAAEVAGHYGCDMHRSSPPSRHAWSNAVPACRQSGYGGSPTESPSHKGFLRAKNEITSWHGYGLTSRRELSALAEGAGVHAFG